MNDARQIVLRGLAELGGEWSMAGIAHNLLELAATRA